MDQVDGLSAAEESELTDNLNETHAKLERLVQIGILLGQELELSKLLRNILVSAKELTYCLAGTIYLKSDDKHLKFAIRTAEDDLPTLEIPLYEPETGEPNDSYVSVWVALHNKTVVIDDVYTEERFDLSGTKRFSEESGFRTISMLTVPISIRQNSVSGVIQLLNATNPETGEIIPFSHDIVRYVEALAAQSAVAIENSRLLESQRKMTESLIQLVAGAIDAKSAHTSGHCTRVPELAFMLAKAANDCNEGELAEFRLETDDEWREFRIGTWLHDCGKITTPEYVVDKATKLETIYNRIHEIRTRFEVLLRDAQITRLEAIAAGTPASDADSAYEQRKNQLFDDFAFLAVCNQGSERMESENIERLNAIGKQTWTRHFDDTLGLSNEELRRRAAYPSSTLPAEEPLLSDKPFHVIERTESRSYDPKYNFKLNVPANLYNYGELYNLSILSGTLTEEERFKINEHVIQTIIMLDNMSFPDNFSRVIDYAGTHHETMIGTGYPRKLSRNELSVPARITAIADIFEALTASDRPYKKAKSLSEAIKILVGFKKREHIDPDLFDLFLTSGVYLRYAQKYLKPEQLDEVDINDFL